MTELVFLEPWICKGSERIGAVGIDLGPCQPVARIANVVLQDATDPLSPYSLSTPNRQDKMSHVFWRSSDQLPTNAIRCHSAIDNTQQTMQTKPRRARTGRSIHTGTGTCGQNTGRSRQTILHGILLPATPVHGPLYIQQSQAIQGLRSYFSF
ncbi:hypothetical protein RRG08_030781 [Elysia crispata]|uniref:Uncharacterized protein n=1 Tax=Elysia crispata TaxID=231223 RepID=A0AAE0YGY3_9GAST|nr:hypothetical protein RRG08_030781 [Elysia crispata]